MRLKTRVLVLGATGYIGGSALAAFLEAEKNGVENYLLFSALVRKQEHVDKLKEVGVNGILFKDLDDFECIRDAAKIHDVVLNAASARHKGPVKDCIEGLAMRKETTGKEVHYVHTSGASMVGDWPESGRRVDTSIHSDMQEDIYTLEKNHPEDLSPVRKVDVFVVEFGETKGVNTYIVTPPLIWGRGTGIFSEGVGQVHQLIQLALKKKQAVMIGSGSGIWSRVHIRDLSNLYYLLITAILSNTKPPSGKSGYYFAANSFQSWKSIAVSIGRAAKKLGIFETSEVGKIGLQEVAEELFDGSLTNAEAVLGSNSRIEADRARQFLNWTPGFDEEDFEKEIVEVVTIMAKQQNASS